jgi:hypothetical protein
MSGGKLGDVDAVTLGFFDVLDRRVVVAGERQAMRVSEGDDAWAVGVGAFAADSLAFAYDVDEFVFRLSGLALISTLRIYAA